MNAIAMLATQITKAARFAKPRNYMMIFTNGGKPCRPYAIYF